VGALHTSGHLADLAIVLKNTFGDDSLYPIPVLTGLLSSIVDNSALVTAAKDMYMFEVDHKFWHLVALTAGTGGSCLIIGSAAGIAAMGLTKMSFGWYAKNISIWALLGYVAGIATFWLLSFLH
jgi:Na+/H+ antiporter NhaD/arsenite permease-like protein